MPRTRKFTISKNGASQEKGLPSRLPNVGQSQEISTGDYAESPKRNMRFFGWGFGGWLGFGPGSVATFKFHRTP